MIRIDNYDELPSSGIAYGGHSGSKKGVIIDNERWFLKYPKSTKSMQVNGLSYTTTPISEYLGSHIYELIGLETHQTRLGIVNNKVVVACKDFLNSSEIILDYNAIKNEYNEKVEEELDKINSSFGKTELEEILVVMKNNIYFSKQPELKNRFWDMFVIDALIGNNDRNDNNWGLIIDKNTRKTRIVPVFDNGASFNNKSSDEKLNYIYNDSFKFHQIAYESSRSIYTQGNSYINPLKYIESMKNNDCNMAILRIVPNIKIEKILEIFDDIPKESNGLTVLSDMQRKFYIKTLIYRYENVLLPVYNELIKFN